MAEEFDSFTAPMTAEKRYEHLRGKRADAAAREFESEAIGHIVDVMRDPLSEQKDRLKAAEMLLERGSGKPTQAIIAIPASRRQAELASQLSDEELMGIMRAQPLPRLAAPTVDAEFTEVEGDTDPLLR